MKPATSLPFFRPTWAEIDLGRLQSNVAALRNQTEPDVGVIACVKANAYGHGIIEVSKVLCDNCRVEMLAVASVDEGITLRNSGISAPILLLSAMMPDQAEAAVANNLTATIGADEVIEALDAVAKTAQRRATCHLKIDTGMSRGGVAKEKAKSTLEKIGIKKSLDLTGLYTHFACADEEENDMTRQQLARFTKVLSEVKSSLPQQITIHAANSAALLSVSDSHFTSVRPGLAIYGASPFGNTESKTVKPVMNLHSKVSEVRCVREGAAVSYGATWRAPCDSVLALIPIGYGDGYPRSLSNRGQVFIREQPFPVVGRVTMDQILVDCTSMKPQLQVGEDVELWGDNIAVEQVADWAGTISYELLCQVSSRVPRVFV